MPDRRNKPAACSVLGRLTEEVERGQRCAFSPVDLSIDYDLIVAARDRIVELEEKNAELEKKNTELEERCLYGRFI